jgi:hypothetical protein
VFALALLVYTINLHSIASGGDSEPAKHLPVSILRHGSLYLDEVAPLYQGYIWPIDVPSEGRFHGVVFRRGHWVSAYPVVIPLLAAPLYVPVVWLLDRYAVPDGHPLALSLLDLMEKATAATMAAASAAVLLLVLRRFCPPRTATVLVLLYAFGSNTWVVSSQAMWQHGMSELLIAVALLWLLRGTREEGGRARLALAGSGLALALAVANRPPNAILAVALALYVVHCLRGRSWPFFLCPPVVAALQLGYNLYFFGSLAGAQGGRAAEWSTPILEGLAGLLVSPSRGLFLYTPWTLFSVGGAILAWRSPSWLLLRYLSIAVAAQLLLYSRWMMWWGGAGFGPRLITDLLPLLTLLLVPVVAVARSRALRALLAAAAVIAIAIQAVGAFLVFPGLDEPARLWSWRRSQLAVAWGDRMPAPATQLRNWIALRDLFALDAGERRAAFRAAGGGVVHRAVLLPSTAGVVARHPMANRGWVRRSAPGERGLLVVDSYLPLSPGRYRARLRMRAWPPSGVPAAGVQVSTGSPRRRLARVAAASVGGADGSFGELTVPFEVPPGAERQRVELALFVSGAAAVELEQVEVEFDRAAPAAPLAGAAEAAPREHP